MFTDKDVRKVLNLYGANATLGCIYIEHHDGETLKEVEVDENVMDDDLDSDTYSLDNVSEDDKNLIDVRLRKINEVIKNPNVSVLEEKS